MYPAAFAVFANAFASAAERHALTTRYWVFFFAAVSVNTRNTDGDSAVFAFTITVFAAVFDGPTASCTKNFPGTGAAVGTEVAGVDATVVKVLATVVVVVVAANAGIANTTLPVRTSGARKKRFMRSPKVGF